MERITTNEHEKRLRELCLLEEATALGRLGTASVGLTSDQAESGLRLHGPNVLAGDRKPNLVLEILRRFVDPLVASCSDWITPSVIGAMVLLSVFLAYF